MRTLLLFLALSILPMMSAQTPPPADPNIRHAVFAGGCFWCLQPFFDQVPGVVSVTVGYTGGRVPNPTYEQVAGRGTGHREAVDVAYEPAKVSYERLLEIYWQSIDPIDGGGQFYDRGEEYTTAIFYGDEEQKIQAEASKAGIQKRFDLKKMRIATKILPASVFYPAESFHQSFYKKSPARYEAYKNAAGHDEKLEEIWRGL